jgi:beta-phosphoglucomutase
MIHAPEAAERPLAVLFDFNGVLVDDEPVHHAAYAEVFSRYGWQLDTEDYFVRYLGLDDRGMIERFLGDRGHPAPAADLARLVDEKARAYAMRLPEVRLFPGAAEALRAIARKVPVAIVSGALRSEIEAILARFGLAGCVAAIVAAEDVPRGKPAPDGYRLGLERLGHPPAGRCLAIEDSPAGVEAALAAGLACWAIASSRQASELSRAARVLPVLEGLSYEQLALCG